MALRDIRVSESRFHGTLEKKESFLRSKKYTCCIKNGRLYYFREGENKAPGCIDLSRTQTICCKGANVIEFVTSTKVHTFMAASSELQEKWIKSLHEEMRVSRCSSRMSNQLTASYMEPLSDDEDEQQTQIASNQQRSPSSTSSSILNNNNLPSKLTSQPIAENKFEEFNCHQDNPEVWKNSPKQRNQQGSTTETPKMGANFPEIIPQSTIPSTAPTSVPAPPAVVPRKTASTVAQTSVSDVVPLLPEVVRRTTVPPSVSDDVSPKVVRRKTLSAIEKQISVPGIVPPEVVTRTPTTLPTSVSDDVPPKIIPRRTLSTVPAPTYVSSVVSSEVVTSISPPTIPTSVPEDVPPKVVPRRILSSVPAQNSILDGFETLTVGGVAVEPAPNLPQNLSETGEVLAKVVEVSNVTPRIPLEDPGQSSTSVPNPETTKPAAYNSNSSGVLMRKPSVHMPVVDSNSYADTDNSVKYQTPQISIELEIDLKAEPILGLPYLPVEQSETFNKMREFIAQNYYEKSGHDSWDCPSDFGSAIQELKSFLKN